MSKRNWVVVLGATFAVFALGAAAYGSASQSPGGARLAVSPANALTEPEPHAEDDFFLGPAPSGFQPKVSADDAVNVAATQEPLESADSIQPTLATLTMPDLRPVDPETDKPIGPPYVVDEPVWVVTVDGICAAPAPAAFQLGDSAKGVVPSVDPCPYHQSKIIINATTGEVIIEATFKGDSRQT
jgi:hypothetical protein